MIKIYEKAEKFQF